MNIGDKVRLIHSKEEGIIYRFLPNDVIEIEIEEGFRLPVLRREVALVAAAEAQYFKKTATENTDIMKQQKPTNTGIFADKGIFMAFVPLNDRDIVLHLINNTDWDLPYSISTPVEQHQRGISGGYLKAKSSIKIQDLLVKDFDNWGTFIFQCLYFTVGFAPERTPLMKRMKFRVNTFFKNKRKAPLIDKDAYLFQIDSEEAIANTLNPQQLKEQILQPKDSSSTISAIRPETVVDLHIEKIITDYSKLSNSQIIEQQIKVFEQQLESAIATGMDEITFIHGVGNGILRTELHRRLSRHKNVKFFEDAQKEKFGYGATKVKIK